MNTLKILRIKPRNKMRKEGGKNKTILLNLNRINLGTLALAYCLYLNWLGLFRVVGVNSIAFSDEFNTDKLHCRTPFSTPPLSSYLSVGQVVTWRPVDGVQKSSHASNYGGAHEQAYCVEE